MTIKEAILKTLEDLKNLANNVTVYEHIISNGYYKFTQGKTPKATISAQLGSFIRDNDSRVKRVKGKGAIYLYYLSKYEELINFDDFPLLTEETTKEIKQPNKTYQERDLHKLLSSYLKNQNIYSKTIFHEQSTMSNDGHQKWVHPDMVGIDFIHLTSKANQALMKVTNNLDTFKISSYELKKEINTDYELKKTYFQAVSNSSWANYGYLVAFDISSSLINEIERLNQSFGIGVIELKSNPYESKILFPSKYKELDFKTIDKLCKINPAFEDFIELSEKTLTASERYLNSIKNELDSFCDNYLKLDSEFEAYCKDKHIPLDSFDEDI
ncbi:hypothetical protein [uncultured Cocleimonas sp.]|uniref:hypothetical protein n=1 Tax=uncultured Cocleimonas sp. TaxID=1051587 RepID=UPI0026148D4D|nr:hypothetical protein [uncultured Cocleimonas sp.]